MKQITTLIVSILFTLSFYGQKQRYLSFELGGAGGLGSFNYEKSFYKVNKIDLIFRTGFSIMPIDKNNGVVLVFPQMGHLLYGEKVHKIDVGMGFAPSITTTLNGAFIRFPLSFGYRIEPKNKNCYWRFAYTPLVSFLIDFQWQHWAGITFGYKLNSKNESK